jgi:hypothetical protein
MHRRHVLAAMAAAAAPALAHAAGPRAVPPFSTAALGAGPPAGWTHETLPRVPRANAFAIVEDDGTRVLQVQSSASASSLLAPVAGPPGAAPVLRWRWKVSRALPGSDMRRKEGDDYAARLYVMFDLPADRLSLGDRLRLQTARIASGREIPAAALCYVWGQAQPAGASGPNPFTDRVRMVVVDSGGGFAGRWRTAERDLARDWAATFGGPMPPAVAVAVGSDTDNTGEAVDTWFGDLVLA